MPTSTVSTRVKPAVSLPAIVTTSRSTPSTKTWPEMRPSVAGGGGTIISAKLFSAEMVAPPLRLMQTPS